MAITYFDSVSVPSDNGTNSSSLFSITPPANMLEGDLCILISYQRGNGGSCQIFDSGGQAWSPFSGTGSVFDNSSINNISCWVYWCRFNGTWDTNPSVNWGASGTNTNAVMHVFRPTTGSNVWDEDDLLNNWSLFSSTAPSSPFTCTAQAWADTTHASTIALALFITADDNTWGSLSGSGWSVTGLAQYRNTSGQDMSSSYAHNIRTTAGALANVSKNQATLGGDAYLWSRLVWYESAGNTTVDKTITGIARITAITDRTITGIARIHATTDKTITGIARIQKTVDQIITGVARIQKTIDQTITGIARIQKTVDQTITGIARIQKTVDQIITGVANITTIVTTDRTITGIARIQKTVDQTITGITRITATADQNITGIARIQQIIDEAINGIARIQATIDQTITGVANIAVIGTVDQDITGLARIQQTVDQAITGIARIQQAVDQTIIGIARIQQVVDETITGIARIQATTDQTINGKARIIPLGTGFYPFNCPETSIIFEKQNPDIGETVIVSENNCNTIILNSTV